MFQNKYFIFTNTKITNIKGGKTMTTKELLYVEDALGHEQYFQSQCAQTAQQIQDGDLKNFAQQMQQKHQEIFSNFYSLL